MEESTFLHLLTINQDTHGFIYFKQKNEVFEKFIEWEAIVERTTGRKVKSIRSDNGGKYTLNEFDNYFKGEGLRHQTTIPKTPEQNVVAEDESHP